MSWFFLVLAGLLEIAWAVGLKYTQGFTRPLPSLLTAAAIIASLVLLSLAVRELPIGTAYAIWVGIGAIGAAVLGIWLFKEPVSLLRIGSLALLVMAMIGLKLSSPESNHG
jgi:quaternary ammonium compound-resistance protein SugE